MTLRRDDNMVIPFTLGLRYERTAFKDLNGQNKDWQYENTFRRTIWGHKGMSMRLAARRGKGEKVLSHKNARHVVMDTAII